MKLPRFAVRWLSTYAATNLRTEVVELLKENQELRARQITLYGAIRSRLQSWLARFATAEIRRELLQVRSTNEVLQRRCDHQADQIAELNRQLVRETVDSVRAVRGQHVALKGQYQATASEFVNQERYRK